MVVAAVAAVDNVSVAVELLELELELGFVLLLYQASDPQVIPAKARTPPNNSIQYFDKNEGVSLSQSSAWPLFSLVL